MILDERRRRASDALALTDEILLIGAGGPVPIPGGMDQVHLFHPHPHHQWLTGRRTPGSVLAFDPLEGRWRDFCPPVTDDDRVWEGRTEAPGEPIGALWPWLAARAGRPVVVLGAPVAGLTGDLSRAVKLEPRLLDARRPKDGAELSLIGRAIAATASGFEAARSAIARSGVTEREIEIELQAACFRAGGEGMGYHTTVGSGPNASVLHFSPGPREVGPGEFVLIDAGCHVEGYTADVTRTYVKGPISQRHRDLHAVVLDAERAAIAGCTPGTEWRELHLRTAQRLAEGLVHLRILRGEPVGLVERDAHANFFPHGLGHLVGLGVRDASGLLPGRERSDRFGLAFLRMDLPLRAGLVTTVEPGLYFIEPLLRQQARRDRFADCTDWAEVDRWIGIGGVRIEDDVLVTETGPVNLTAAIGTSPECVPERV